MFSGSLLPRRRVPLAGTLCLLLAGSACGGSGSDVFGNDDDGAGGAGGAGAATSGPGGPAASTGAGAPTSSGNGATTTTTAGPGGTQSSSGAGGSPCASGPDEDADGDGATPSTGDCNDCDASIGPTADEVPNDGEDDDCDGVVDETRTCDDALPLANGDPLTAARAMGLCATADADGFGVVDARWIRADGSAASQSLQAGVLPSFGPAVAPLEGARLLALSSGRARLPGAEACGTESCEASAGVAPFGFPQSIPGCPTAEPNIADDIGLEVTLRPPADATGYRYRFRFYSFEFPEYVCTTFTDQFVALATPAPPGAVNGNVSSFAGLPVSVNVPIASCATCEPWAEQCVNEQVFDPDIDCPDAPSPCCPEGPGALSGTGFDVWASSGAGATAWLETRVPLAGADEVTLRFVIWDTGDGALDSTVLLDDFAWIAGEAVTLGTAPVAE